MALAPQSPVTFTGKLTAKPSALDLLQSSSSGVCGVPLRALGKAKLGAQRRDFAVFAKLLKKTKKHDYPWPQDPDPNIEGGVLRHLSPFKPLKDKPKPVILEFEKPLMDLRKKIIDVQKTANETGLDFNDQIILLENKYQQALENLYTHLTPIQRVHIARHPNRPTFLDHVFNITETFVELHGDRAGYDDPAIVTGLGAINGKTYMFIGQQKGRNTKENIQRNFAMPTPHGYRKALRMMYYAEHHGFPIISFIDTPGAYADLKSEELGQGEAIAHNLRTMFGLKVPIISIVIGEGGSGGALAIACGNKVLMLENAVYYVASPEACAAILYKSAKASPKAAKRLKLTAAELCRLQIADGVIPEPLGGAHADPYWTSQQIKAAILGAMDELVKMETSELLKHRSLKFRKIGWYRDRVPLEPAKKSKLKKRESLLHLPGRTSDAELNDKLENLKQQILKASDSSKIFMMIDKLKMEIDCEFSEAAKALGLEDKFEVVREEFARRGNPNDPLLQEKIDSLQLEFEQNLSAAPNYESLKFKLDMLNDMSKALNDPERRSKADKLKQVIQELADRPDIKQKIETLKTEIENSGMSESREKILQLNNEISLEAARILKSEGLSAVDPPVDVLAKADQFNREMKEVLESLIHSTDLKNKVELFKAEVAKAAEAPDAMTDAKIEVLQRQIKQSLVEVLSASELKSKHEELIAEISEATESSGGSNGRLKFDNKLESDKAKTQVKVGSNYA